MLGELLIIFILMVSISAFEWLNLLKCQKNAIYYFFYSIFISINILIMLWTVSTFPITFTTTAFIMLIIVQILMKCGYLSQKHHLIEKIHIVLSDTIYSVFMIFLIPVMSIIDTSQYEKLSVFYVLYVISILILLSIFHMLLKYEKKSILSLLLTYTLPAFITLYFLLDGYGLYVSWDINILPILLSYNIFSPCIIYILKRKLYAN